MTPEQSLFAFFQQYGWVGVGIWFFFRDVAPFLKDKWFPAALEERKRVQLYRQNLEERQVIAWEGVVNTLNQIEIAITANNERLSSAISQFTQHDKAMLEGMTVMRERTRPLPGQKEKSRPLPRTGG